MVWFGVLLILFENHGLERDIYFRAAVSFDILRIAILIGMCVLLIWRLVEVYVRLKTGEITHIVLSIILVVSVISTGCMGLFAISFGYHVFAYAFIVLSAECCHLIWAFSQSPEEVEDITTFPRKTILGIYGFGAFLYFLIVAAQVIRFFIVPNENPYTV